LILGEYDFSGLTPYVGATLLGLMVAEVVLAVGHDTSPPVPTAAGALAGGGVAWAAWISSGRGVASVPGSAWAGTALAAALAFVWVKLSPVSGRRRGGPR